MTTAHSAFFQTMADRAWFAWQCLPRDKFGKPPPFRKIEREHGLSNNTIRKLTRGELVRPGYPVIKRAAAALGVSPDWLMEGIGEGPIARYPVPPRPLLTEGEEILDEVDDPYPSRAEAVNMARLLGTVEDARILDVLAEVHQTDPGPSYWRQRLGVADVPSLPPRQPAQKPRRTKRQ
jgi:transcriptional regulator with XRE-family HTH domain